MFSSRSKCWKSVERNDYINKIEDKRTKSQIYACEMGMQNILTVDENECRNGTGNVGVILQVFGL